MAILFQTAGKVTLIICQQFLQSNSHLMQIPDAFDIPRFAFRFRDGRQQKRGQNPDDGNNDQ